MGLLSDFNLSELATKYGARYLIETGAGAGNGINHARKYPFSWIWSCEIDKDQAAILNGTIGKQDPRAKVFPLPSDEFLELVLPQVRHNAIFFLDAHFPGADLGKAAFDAEPNLDIRLPLETELDLIYEKREAFQDVIIADDWRIYESMPMQGGDLAAAGLGHLMKRDTSFLDKWLDTHNVEKQARNTGYVLITPK